MELVGQKQLEIQYLFFEVFESDGFLRIILWTSPQKDAVACQLRLKELKGWVCLSSVLGDPESERLDIPRLKLAFSPLKIVQAPKRKVVFQPSIFRVRASFKEGTPPKLTCHLKINGWKIFHFLLKRYFFGGGDMLIFEEEYIRVV